MTQKLQEQFKMQLDRQEIHHLLKYGRGDEVREMFEQQKRENYPQEFVPFMERMISEHKISRKNVAVRSGLSQDYVYKLLRGDKHTDERDYILAMCFAIGMNLAQTQHALLSYGMPMLSRGDARSNIIILAIENNDDIDELDSMLDKVGYPLLKTSPDMPSAKIVDIMPSDVIAEDAPAERKSDNVRHSFEEIDSGTNGYPNGGGAPFDYNYEGWIKLKDEDGNVYQIEAIFRSDDSSFIVFTEDQRREAERLMELRQNLQAEFYEKHKAELEPTGGQINPFTQPELYEEFIALNAGIPDAEMLEYYESIEDTAVSEFFPFFLEIDKRTDKKVQEIMKKLDDTREFNMRTGASWKGDGQPQCYIEMFNYKQPELREYFQLVENSDGTCRYTATHESCFMQMDMGQELYEVYFGSKREPEYYIDTDKNEFSGSQTRYHYIFNAMKAALHDNMKRTGFSVMMKYEENTDEKVEFLVDQGITYHQSGDEEKALEFYKEALAELEASGNVLETHLAAYVCTLYKIASALSLMKNPEENEWWQRIYDLKDTVTEAFDSDSSTNTGAISSVADAAMRLYCGAWIENDYTTAEKYISDIIDMIDGHNACADEWETQFLAFSRHAVLIEDQNLEKAMSEYRRALTIARNHHLDQNPACARSVAVQNNNYAWVLWNRCGSEEAILYYGRAIDLLESYLFSGIVDRNIVLEDLEHMGNALNGIYTDTNRFKESGYLKERLAENGVILE